MSRRLIDPPSVHPDKVENIRQWNADPCGAVEGLDPDSAAYWRRVDEGRYERYAPWMRATLGFERYPAQRLLEVGFGLGTDLMQFARGGSEVYGIDLTPRHVELTARRFRACGLRARLLRADAEVLPYRSETFDIVYSFGVLHHTPDALGAIAEIHRVLRPGGQFIMSVYHRYSVPIAWKLVDGMVRGQLWRQGWRTFLSTIEHRSDPTSARPLVRLYSRMELKRALAGFGRVRIIARHSGLDAESPNPLKRAIKQVARRLVSDEALASRFGFYLIAFAVK